MRIIWTYDGNTDTFNYETTGNQGIVMVDPDGNDIESHITQSGGYHLGVQMQQDVEADAGNSSTTNLTAGNSYTFTGVGKTTLGIVGLQWSLKTDQNATVYIEESPDNTNWDISNVFDYIASKGGVGATVQASQSYWRIRVVLTVSINTTYFRLQGILCPIATPLPSSLSHYRRLKTESVLVSPEDTERHGFISPLGALTTVETVRLVGTNFGGAIKDTNFWTETVTNNGTVTQSGEIILATNTTSNGTAKYESVQKGRFVASGPMKFFGFIQFITALTANNIRRFGPYDTNDGFFFQTNGTTFGVGTRTSVTGSPIDTIVATGSFNGNYGTTWSPTIGTYCKFEIEYGLFGVLFYIDDKLLHTISPTELTKTLELPITLDCANSGGADINISLHILGATIIRQGRLETNPTYYHLSGNNATHVLKRGAGVLQKIMFNNTSGTTITIYDNVEASGAVIGIITTTTGAIGEWEYNVPFNIGLTFVTVGNSLDATIIYE